MAKVVSSVCVCVCVCACVCVCVCVRACVCVCVRTIRTHITRRAKLSLISRTGSNIANIYNELITCYFCGLQVNIPLREVFLIYISPSGE